MATTSPRSLPRPRTPDPASAPPLRWGVLGPGSIAREFTGSLTGTRQRVVAVGSRDSARARSFADDFSVPKVHASYEGLVADPDVDVVYVASPHSHHHEHTLLALRAGKHVLVEKAFTRNAAEAEDVLEEAGSSGLFAMEAMWSRFLPHYDVVRQAVESGLLGDVVTVQADHGQPIWPNGPQRLADPNLAGGALLDLGVYPISFAHLVLGAPTSVRASGTLTDQGVDAQCTASLVAASGAHAVISTTMAAKTPTTAAVCGTEARLEIAGDFYMPNTVRLVAPGGEVLDSYEVDPAERHDGLRYEAAEVARCLADGRRESPLMTWQDTRDVMRVMDEVRAQVGVRYPGE